MEARRVQLNVDLAKLKESAVLSVRRAAAFLGVGINATNSWSKPILDLDASVQWRFFPDDIPADDLNNIVSEFRNWVIGNALRELDAGFNIFLDQVWGTKEWLKLHNTTVPSGYSISSIESETNAANKLEKILGDIEGSIENVARLKTLSNLRNCLTHARGLVTARHAKQEGALVVKWLGFDLIMEVDGAEPKVQTSLEEAIERGTVFPAGATISLKVSERIKLFELNSVVILKPGELQEICFFYLQLTDQVMLALQNFMKKIGIQFPADGEAKAEK